MKYQPILFLQYLGKQQNQPPNIGDFVITLTSGFRSTEPGILLQVTGSDNLCIYLQAKNQNKFAVEKKIWYEKLFLIRPEYLTYEIKNQFVLPKTEKR